MDIIRTPSETRSGKMAPLARLPVFLALDGKRALLAGGSRGRGLEGGTAVGGRGPCGGLRGRAVR